MPLPCAPPALPARSWWRGSGLQSTASDTVALQVPWAEVQRAPRVGHSFVTLARELSCWKPPSSMVRSAGAPLRCAACSLKTTEVRTEITKRCKHVQISLQAYACTDRQARCTKTQSETRRWPRRAAPPPPPLPAPCPPRIASRLWAARACQGWGGIGEEGGRGSGRSRSEGAEYVWSIEHTAMHPSAGRSCSSQSSPACAHRQVGQLLVCASQGAAQSGWKMCLPSHGITCTSEPTPSSSLRHATEARGR